MLCRNCSHCFCGRFFKKPIHNDLVELLIKRVKNMLGYPECATALVSPTTLLYR